MTSRRRKPLSGVTPAKGRKDDSADDPQSREPSQGQMARAAREDMERGVVDTDRGPVMNETYERVRGDDDPEKKFSP